MVFFSWFKLNKKSTCCNSVTRHQIATNFCTSHHSIVAVSHTKFLLQSLVLNQEESKMTFPSNLNCYGKGISEMGPGFIRPHCKETVQCDKVELYNIASSVIPSWALYQSKDWYICIFGWNMRFNIQRVDAHMWLNIYCSCFLKYIYHSKD